MENASLEHLGILLEYEPETGRFFWRYRPVEMFKRERVFKWWNRVYAGQVAGGIDRQGYRKVTINGKYVALHRLAWAFMFGRWPDGEIDHINGDKSDNRIANLHDVGRSENSRNMPIQSNNRSGVTGVSRVSKTGLWRADIYRNRRQVHLGSFPTKEQAIAARKAAEKGLGYSPLHGRKSA